MGSRWQVAFSVGPLALYLYLLARWHGGRHPRVVSGPVDFALAGLAVGGLALFGPIGRTLGRLLFGPMTATAWLALGSGAVVAALLTSRRAWRQVVVYHVDPRTLDRALREALGQCGGRYARTLRGYEDVATGRGVWVELGPGGPTATLEVSGEDAEPFAGDLDRALRQVLRGAAVPPSRVAWLYLGGSGLTVLAPVVGWLLTQPRAREALRVLFERLPGV